MQNKIGFQNRQVHIHTDQKWSTQYKNGFEMPQLTSDWPGDTLKGLKGPKLVSQGWPGPDRSQLGHLRANLALIRPLQIIPDMTLSISESYFVYQISQAPNIAQKWFCIQNLHMDLSFQKKKTVWKYFSRLLRYLTNYEI